MKGYNPPERRPSEITITTLSILIIRYSTISSTLHLALRRSMDLPKTDRVYTVYGISDCATPSYGRSERPPYTFYIHVARKKVDWWRRTALADATNNVMHLINWNFKTWRLFSFYGMVNERWRGYGLQYRHPRVSFFDRCGAPRLIRIISLGLVHFDHIAILRCINGIIMSPVSRAHIHKSAVFSLTDLIDSGAPCSNSS